MSIELLLLREYKRLETNEEYKEIKKRVIDALHKDKWNNLALKILKELKIESSEDKHQAMIIELETLGSIIEEPKIKESRLK